MTTAALTLLLFACLASLIGGLLLYRDNRRLRAKLRLEQRIVEDLAARAGIEVIRTRGVFHGCNCPACAANRRVAN